MAWVLGIVAVLSFCAAYPVIAVMLTAIVVLGLLIVLKLLQ